MVLVLVLLLCIFAVSGSLFQSGRGVNDEAEEVSSRQDGNASAVVFGIVKDSETGKPVSGALIVNASGAVADQTAGVDGSYRYDGLLEGVYRFEVSAHGYKNKTVQVVLTKNSTVSFDIELAPDVEEDEDFNVFFWVGVGVFVTLVGLLVTIYYVSGRKRSKDSEND